MKLVVFYTKKGLFSIYGNYHVENVDKDGAVFPVPQFETLKVKEIKEDGREVDYNPTGETWNGRKYDEYDIMHEFIMHTIINDNAYVSVYVEQGIARLISEYTGPEVAITTVNSLSIPGKILNYSMDVYEAVLITNEYIYYSNDESLLMLKTSTHEIVSDNYFAEQGYLDSLKAVKEGTERLIWGQVSEKMEG